jgi:Mg2+ and Co2+ transporter CorA
VANDPRFGRLDAGTFLGLLLDGLMDGYHASVEAIEVDIDELDARALEDRDPEGILDALVTIRRRIGTLRRSLSPQREVFAALVRPATGDDPSAVGWPWPGLGARFERVLDGIENAREELIGTFDLVSTQTGQRTNDVMRVLTVVSSLLLPSVVIAGVMGMNFKEPFFDQPSNFFVVLGLMGALALVILLVARHRRWL